MSSEEIAAPTGELVDGGYERIRQMLPHQEPFIFVERIVELTAGRRIVCLKNVSCNEWYMRAHFPELAIMPGVLIIEALAQAALLLVMSSSPDRRGQLGVLHAARTRFHRVVVPGDQLMLEVTMEKMISTGCVVSARAMVDGQAAATAEMTFGVADKQKLLEQRRAAPAQAP